MPKMLDNLLNKHPAYVLTVLPLLMVAMVVALAWNIIMFVFYFVMAIAKVVWRIYRWVRQRLTYDR